MVTVSLMLPEPAAVLPVTPTDPTDVYETLVKVGENVSLTVAPVWVSGPLFVTTMVYVTVEPGTAGSGVSDLVIDKSAMLGWKPQTTGSVSTPLGRKGT